MFWQGSQLFGAQNPKILYPLILLRYVKTFWVTWYIWVIQQVAFMRGNNGLFPKIK